jgi:hypothetical protein
MYNQAWMAASVAQAHVQRANPFAQDAMRWYRAAPIDPTSQNALVAAPPRLALPFVKEDLKRWWTEPTLVRERVWLSSVDFANDRARLTSVGITHICNATGDLPRFYKDAFTYHKTGWFDDDHAACTPEQYRAAYDFVDKALSEDPKAQVLVHCAAGRSRSASIILYYLCRKDGLSLQEGMLRLYNARSIVMINERFVACVALTLAEDAKDGAMDEARNPTHHHALLLENFVLQK